MPRKHGTVRSGKNTTYYGNDATDYMAKQWMVNCFDNRKAAKFVNEQKDGPYKDALIAHGKRLRIIEDAKKKGRVKACKKLL